MTLIELCTRAGILAPGDLQSPEIKHLTLDSRLIQPGSLFVCMPSNRQDSHAFLPAAAGAGAVAAIVHHEAAVETARALGLTAVFLPADHYPDTLWQLARAFYNSPTASYKLIGVTGTNGKTTTAWIMRQMLTALGLRAGYLGTLGFTLPETSIELNNTTPFALELYALLDQAKRANLDALCMEVSSHALAEKRADGLEFDSAIFTNLTQDHLDFHGTLEQYADAKFRLFSELPLQSEKRFRAAINVADPVGRSFADRTSQPVLTFSTNPEIEADYDYIATDVQLDSISFDLKTPTGNHRLKAGLGGLFNVENLASALTGLIAAGYSLDDLLNTTENLKPVPGRFENVPIEANFRVIVDYAHTPDAVEKLLDSVRPLTAGRVITVVGCGGDRDKTKRPLMGFAASERSDFTIVTSDNPRTEDPETIVGEVLNGIAPNRPALAIVDRAEAIAHAVGFASENDVVVIAGKGHENYQIIGHQKFPFDDREFVREALKK